MFSFVVLLGFFLNGGNWFLN